MGEHTGKADCPECSRDRQKQIGGIKTEAARAVEEKGKRAVEVLDRMQEDARLLVQILGATKNVEEVLDTVAMLRERAFIMREQPESLVHVSPLLDAFANMVRGDEG